MAAPVFRHYGGDERMDRNSIPVADAVEIKPGWFVNEVGGLCVVTDAVAEDANFAGVALTGHEQNKDYRSSISVAEKCEVDVDVVSASYVRGAGLKLNSANGGDDLELVADGGGDTIAWAAETATTVTRLRVRIDVYAIQKLRGQVSA